MVGPGPYLASLRHCFNIFKIQVLCKKLDSFVYDRCFSCSGIFLYAEEGPRPGKQLNEKQIAC